MPQIGHCAKAGVGPLRHFREIRLAAATDQTLGASVNVSLFSDVKFVDVIGTSKGKGFAGVMKRYHFGGQCASHGTERKHRSPGSIASRATWRGQCGKPKKGVRMAGHMGVDRVTTRNHSLVKIDPERNLMLIKGALPGANGAVVVHPQVDHSAYPSGSTGLKRPRQKRRRSNASVARKWRDEMTNKDQNHD